MCGGRSLKVCDIFIHGGMETVFASKLGFCLLLLEKSSEASELPLPSVTHHSRAFLLVKMSLPVRGSSVGNFMMAGGGPVLSHPGSTGT